MTWPTVQLRRLFRVVNGGTPTTDEINWNGGIPWATPVDLSKANGSIDRTERTLTRQGADSGSATAPRGSILLSTRAPIGYVASLETDMAFNQGCKALVPSSEVDVRFFRYQLASMCAYLNSRGQGSTFSELSAMELAATPVASPELEDQRRIADFLDAETNHLDRVAAAYGELSDRLQERRSSAVHELVVGANHAMRVPSGLKWADSLPASWHTIRVNFVARMGSGHTPSRSKPEWWIDCAIPWVTTGEVAELRDDRREVINETRERISHLGVSNSSAAVHPAGTVVLSRTASAGFSGVIGCDMATSQDFVTWTCGDRLDPFYLLWCLRVMRQDLLGRLATGSTHKTIYVPDLQALRIPLPPIREQRRIVEEIRRSNDLTDRLLDSVDQQDSLLAERRQALITAAVTGQIDVTTARGADV